MINFLYFYIGISDVWLNIPKNIRYFKFVHITYNTQQNIS
jgi:hypothetical protein